eukprot:767193-Hanusia_phi.AAC.5
MAILSSASCSNVQILSNTLPGAGVLFRRAAKGPSGLLGVAYSIKYTIRWVSDHGGNIRPEVNVEPGKLAVRQGGNLSAGHATRHRASRSEEDMRP